jgi:hypothetical protein
MNAESVQSSSSQAVQELSQEELLIFEPIALRRLSLKRLLILSLKGIRDLGRWFAPVELVREVGPGQRPLQRHEWEKVDLGPRPGC